MNLLERGSRRNAKTQLSEMSYAIEYGPIRTNTPVYRKPSLRTITKDEAVDKPPASLERLQEDQHFETPTISKTYVPGTGYNGFIGTRRRCG
jgi:hypothetical protein